jgi:hypothetical protein
MGLPISHFGTWRGSAGTSIEAAVGPPLPVEIHSQSRLEDIRIITEARPRLIHCKHGAAPDNLVPVLPHARSHGSDSHPAAIAVRRSVRVIDPGTVGGTTRKSPVEDENRRGSKATGAVPRSAVPPEGEE